MAKSLRRLACKFDLDESELKSSQVNASALHALALTCDDSSRRILLFSVTFTCSVKSVIKKCAFSTGVK